MRWRGTPSKEGTHLVIVPFGIGLKRFDDKLRVLVRSLIRHKEIIHGQAITRISSEEKKKKTPEGRNFDRSKVVNDGSRVRREFFVRLRMPNPIQ
jgi:hypothetical protein